MTADDMVAKSNQIKELLKLIGYRGNEIVVFKHRDDGKWTGELLALQSILGHQPGVSYFTDGKKWIVSVLASGNGPDVNASTYSSDSVDLNVARGNVREMMRKEATKRLAEYRKVVAAMAKVLNAEELEDVAGAAAVATGEANAE